MSKHIILLGAPVDCGKRRRGCLMGPDAYRTARISETLESLGHTVEDWGNFSPDPVNKEGPEPIHALGENIGWTQSLAREGQKAAAKGFPVFLGGDHALSLGSVAGMASHAKEQGRPLFVLWLDAHSDYHTPQTSGSGNLHGTPMAYIAGREGFDDFPPFPAPVPQDRLGMIGLRSVDPAEKQALNDGGVLIADMRALDEHGIKAPLTAFLDRVEAANGMLHVSLDVDFLDPSIAPAVGTTVPGGASEREAHLAMELLCDSGRVTSLDMVELNPILDDRGKTATLMVDLCASLFGRRIFDRPTWSHA